MIKIINIQEKEKSLETLKKFANKEYKSMDIEFRNVHLKRINKICNKRLFDKNSLYVRTSTLWEIMQPEGGQNRHHFHGLSEHDILHALKNITDPYCVYISNNGRIAVATMFENIRKDKFLIVIELHCGLENDRFANVNKIVTIYPKKNLDNILSRLSDNEILFKKDNQTLIR